MSEVKAMKNLIFTVENGHSKYIQIYERFKSLIEQGSILANERLPSIRQLADSLQVSRNTTLMAYEQLVAEGYIRGEGRKGYFVNDLEPHIVHEDAFSIPRQQSKPIANFIVDFKAGAVDQANFPLKVWRRIANSVLTLQETFLY